MHGSDIGRNQSCKGQMHTDTAGNQFEEKTVKIFLFFVIH